MDENIKSKIKELTDWINNNLPENRHHIIVGSGRVVAAWKSLGRLSINPQKL